MILNGSGMSIRNLEYLFHPTSVAVFGASTRPTSLGYLVVRNLLRAGYTGPIMPVNPKHRSVAGILAYPDVESLPMSPDLAVICTPPRTVPGIIAKLAERGTNAAVVITAGLTEVRDEQGVDMQTAMLRAAKPYNFRILGHNCLGLIVPRIGLNASFAHTNALPGSVAFISQSGALGTAVLDWANGRGLGFSCFLSLGNMADVDFGDVLDYLAADPETQAILLYIEAIDEARKFLSAARAASRNKPVLAIKAGRVPEGAKAAASHTGALAGADDVYEVALARAGILRVYAFAELFEAVETLARARIIDGERLAILTNGGGPGVMAADALVLGGGKLAKLAPETIAELDAALPQTWSRGNPVDIIGDADGKRYADALRILLNDPNTDAVLILNTPVAVVSSTDVARTVVEEAREHARNVLTNWLGDEAARPGRRLFAEAGIRSYDTPVSAVRAFQHMVRLRKNREQLIETPPSLPDFETDRLAAREIVRIALEEGRTMLTEPEAKQVLQCYGIPVVPTEIARDPDEAATIAGKMGFPVAIKLLSHQITHKSDVGGVVLDLMTPEAVRDAARSMAFRVGQARPDAVVSGFTVQPMARRPGAHELIVGAMTDAVFGPVVLFGAGGTAVEVLADKALALPPLNLKLAREMMERTRVYKLLAGYRERPPADLDGIELTLVKISQLLIDVGEVVELDINPLWADERGVIALDARIRVEKTTLTGAERMAIRPYPRHLEEEAEVEPGLPVFLRPIRPEDEPAHMEFHSKLDPEDIYFRFFGVVRRVPHSQMARYTQIDYDREMAFIAVDRRPGTAGQTLGVVRAVFDPDYRTGEFAIVIRSDMKGHGLGHALLDKLIRYSRERGIGELKGQVLPNNRRMLAFAESFGFSVHQVDTDSVEIRLTLQSAPTMPAGGASKPKH